jgi:hypothetical protein
MTDVRPSEPMTAQVEVVGTDRAILGGQPIEVRVVGFCIGWRQMFVLILQFLICSIPAAVVVWILGLAIGASLIRAILSGLLYRT